MRKLKVSHYLSLVIVFIFYGCASVNVVKKQVFYGVTDICISNSSETIKLFEIEQELKTLGFSTVFEYKEKCIKKDATGRVLFTPRFQLVINTRRLSSTYEIDAKIWDRRFGNYVSAATVSEYVGLIGKSQVALGKIMKELILGTFPDIPLENDNQNKVNTETLKMVESQMKDFRPDLRACYEASLKNVGSRDEVPYGVIGTTFLINTNRQIDDLKFYTDTTISRNSLIECLEEKLKKIAFEGIEPQSGRIKQLFRFFPISKKR